MRIGSVRTFIMWGVRTLVNMLDMVSTYASLWDITKKSAILVFGESPVSRQRNRSLRRWSIGGDIIQEHDMQ